MFGQWSRALNVQRGSVRELASAARVSRSYLNRLFQAEFGMSVAAGLESLRFSRAETLLTRTDMTISSIAYQCGFADLYHFSHRFSLRYGVPPSAYRHVGTGALWALDHPAWDGSLTPCRNDSTARGCPSTSVVGRFATRVDGSKRPSGVTQRAARPAGA